MTESILRSLFTVEGRFCSTQQVLEWLARRNREVSVSISPIPFAKMYGWRFEDSTYNLIHRSGRFFSITGIDVMTNVGVVSRWKQPIIDQPEVGYLGILCKEFDGVMYFLMQAKIEPGNVNCVQLSPTLQATRSNYTCVHGGKCPAYLEYFKQAKPCCVIVDQLQSEQGARFLRKRNRNMIVCVDSNEEIPLGDDFQWLTLGQLKMLMRYDNVVNMDTRTVLSALRISTIGQGPSVGGFGGLLLTSEQALKGEHSIDDALHFMSELKSRYELLVDKIPLSEICGDWQILENEIIRMDRRFFRVFAVDVSISNREVSSWCQPIVQPMQEGLCVLFLKQIRGVLHFLMQAKVECGNFDVVELAPTIQCLTGDFRGVEGDALPRYVAEFIGGSLRGRILSDNLQSEEGGRFYHEQNRNVIMLLDEDEDVPVYENFIWLTLGQVKEFLRFNNYLNIQSRSLISALHYV